MNNEYFCPQKMKVLLVDDTQANLDVLTRILKPNGYKIAVAQNGEQALKITQHFHPDLILMDVMMPGLDGYETCKKIKEMEGLNDMPVIFVTAKNAPEDVLKGFQAGGVDYIGKPFNRDEVCARIGTHLRLRAYAQHLIEMNQQKNKFLGIVAHDLRNPISGIISLTKLILDGSCGMQPNETMQEFLVLMGDASNNMLLLVNDLLDTSAIECGILVLQKAPTPLRMLLNNRIEIIEMQAKNKEIQIHLDCSDSLTADIDPNRIGQVIDNLLSNAIKFSPRQSSVNIHASQEGDSIEVRVNNPGPCIPQNELGQIFDSFKTLSTKATNQEKSTGLGMAIAKKIIETHDGQIWIESQPEQGTTVSFNLTVSPLGSNLENTLNGCALSS
jgi:signal transduction histidine kinase